MPKGLLHIYCKKLFDQTAQLLAVEEVVDHCVVFGPQGQGLAIVLSRALVYLAGETGHGGQCSLHDFDYLADCIIVRIAVELVTAAFAAYSGYHFG